MIVNGLETEIKQRADGMYNVWQKHALSWYDDDFEECLEKVKMHTIQRCGL